MLAFKNHDNLALGGFASGGVGGLDEGGSFGRRRRWLFFLDNFSIIWFQLE